MQAAEILPRQTLRRLSAASELAASHVEHMSTSTAVGLAMLWLAASSATHLKMPLPIGDPILAILAGYARICCAGSLAAGALATAWGQPIAGILVALAAVPLGYKSWKAFSAAEEVRRRFVEGGISTAQQDEMEAAVSSSSPPFVMRISPLLGSLVWDGQCCSGVRVQRHYLDSGYADVWELDPEAQGSQGYSRGIFFFVHGGSWRAMKPRSHAATCNLHSMALAGWKVVACSYRKAEWPQHVEDSFDALKWATQTQWPAHAKGTARNMKLIIAGNSAGGHIAAMLTDRALRNGIHVHGCVFSYGVFDPSDEEGHYPSFCGRSLLATYFENIVLRRQVDLWQTANPMLLPLASYPPTLLLHGSLDAVVPIGQSRQFWTRLAASRTRKSPPQDLFVEVPGARHSYEVSGDPSARAAVVGACAWIKNLPSDYPSA
mmetsp:Transcript_33415/g.76339  ORF Transcript_33415/g.76339 Transcript_33415/m.76339 type:complete len:433 (+) Transcript_33415:110-1408(+)